MSYSKYYPNGWQSGKTGGTPITPEAFNHIEKGLVQAYFDFAPAVESPNYPGCYYRTVDGETEWINPPMVSGVEYRTAERYMGLVVYAKLVDFGYLPNASSASVTITGAGIAYPVRASLLIGGSRTGQGTAIGDGYPYISEFHTGNDAINIATNADMSASYARVEIYYTKG